MGKQIQMFKVGVRRVNKVGVHGECKKYLCAGIKKGYALKRLGVLSHAAAIRGKVRMSQRAQAHVDKEILKANGNLAKDMESQTRGEKMVKAAKLSLKRKVRWTKNVRRFPDALLKDFLEKAPRPEAEEELREGAAKEQEPKKKKKSLARIAAPVHDFVPPPVTKGNKRKASTSTAPKEELVLRASMLSARLRERFGYLCTETG